MNITHMRIKRAVLTAIGESDGWVIAITNYYQARVTLKRAPFGTKSRFLAKGRAWNTAQFEGFFAALNASQHVSELLNIWRDDNGIHAEKVPDEEI